MHTRSETIAPPPAYGDVAKQVIAIASAGRKEGHDQETIRVMLTTFGQALLPGAGSPVIPPRPY